VNLDIYTGILQGNMTPQVGIKNHHISQAQYLPSFGHPSTHITICLYGLFLHYPCIVPYNGCPSGCRSISIPTPCKKCTEHVIMSRRFDIKSVSEKNILKHGPKTDESKNDSRQKGNRVIQVS